MKTFYIYFTIDKFTIEVLTSTPKVVDFFKKQYGLAPTKKRKSVGFFLTCNINLHSPFRIHIHKNRGVLSFSKSEPFSYLSFFFNFIVQVLVIDMDVLLIHGSSVVKDSKGYIFSGPSGIGKTTTLRGISDEHIYSNDVAILKKEGREYMLLCSPFDRYYTAAKKPITLDTIYFLNQAKRLSSSSLSHSKKYEYILKNSIFYYYVSTIITTRKKGASSPQMVDITIDDYSLVLQKNLLRLLAHCQMKVLNKRKDDRVYPLLETL